MPAGGGRGTDREVRLWIRTINAMKPGIQAARRMLGRFTSWTINQAKKIGRAFRDGAMEFQQGIARHARIAMFALAGAAAAGTYVGASFEQGMADVASVARASEEDLAMLEERARSLGRTTAFTAREASEGMKVLALAGLETRQIWAAVEPTLLLAGATQSGLVDSSELLVQTMKQFRMEASDLTHVANLFAASMVTSQLNMQRLAAGMPYVGSAAALLGMDFDEALAALSILVDRLGDGSMAGTSFRTMLAQLQSPTRKLSRALGDVSFKTHTLGEVLDTLQKSGIDAGDAFELIDRRAGQAIGYLLQEGSAGLAKVRANLNSVATAGEKGGAVFEMYYTQMQTVNSQAKIVRSALEDLGIGFFQVFGDDLQNALERTSKLVARITPDVVQFLDGAYKGMVKAADATTEWIEANKSVVVTFVTMASAAVLTATAYTILTNKQIWFLGIMAAVIVATEDSEKRWVSWRTVIDRIGVALKQAKIYIAAFFQTVKTLVVGASRGISRFASGIAEMVKGIWNAAKGFGEVIHGSKGMADALRRIFRGDFRDAVQGAMDGVDQMKNGWAGATADVVGEMSAAVSLIPGIWKQAGIDANKEMLGWLSRAWGDTKTTADRVTDLMGGLLDSAIAAGRKVKEMGQDQLGGMSIDEWLGKLKTYRSAIDEIMKGGGASSPLDEELSDADRYDKLALKYRLFTDTILAANRTFWDTMVEMDMTGKERREKIWDAMKRSFFATISDMVEKYLKSGLVKLVFAFFGGGFGRLVPGPFDWVSPGSVVDSTGYQTRTGAPGTTNRRIPTLPSNRFANGAQGRSMSLHFHGEVNADSPGSMRRLVRRVSDAMAIENPSARLATGLGG